MKQALKENRLARFGRHMYEFISRKPLTSANDNETKEPARFADTSVERAELGGQVRELVAEMDSFSSSLDPQGVLKDASSYRACAYKSPDESASALLKIFEKYNLWTSEFAKLKQKIREKEAGGTPRSRDEFDDMEYHLPSEALHFTKAAVSAAYSLVLAGGLSQSNYSELSRLFDNSHFYRCNGCDIGELYLMRYLEGEIAELSRRNSHVEFRAMELLEKRYAEKGKKGSEIGESIRRGSSISLVITYAPRPPAAPNAERVIIGSPRFRELFQSEDHYTYGVVLASDPPQAVFYEIPTGAC